MMYIDLIERNISQIIFGNLNSREPDEVGEC